MNEIDLAVKILEKDEGFREKPYYDTKMIPTYGHGFICGKQYAELPNISISLEQSRNRLRGMCEVNEKTMLGNPDLSSAYLKCNDVQKAVLLSMAHQLGIYGVLLFKGMLGSLYHSDFIGASICLLDSKAAREDAPARFKRNASMLKTGVLDKYYL